MSDRDFENKVAFITGGASGIGLATAECLAARGAKVAIVDIRLEAAEQAASTLASKHNVKAIGLQANVAKHEDVQRAVDEAVKQLGGIHCALNAAGVPGKGAGVAEYEVQEWSRVMSVNCDGVFFSTKYELQAMLKNKGPNRGSIVNISSLAGSRTLGPQVAYVAAKHAVVGITKAAALEYGRFGIRCNSVAPGFIATPLLEAMATGDLKNDLVSRTPVNRLGQPTDVGELVSFLLSDKATYCNGGDHACDGGIMTSIPGNLTAIEVAHLG